MDSAPPKSRFEERLAYETGQVMHTRHREHRPHCEPEPVGLDFAEEMRSLKN